MSACPSEVLPVQTQVVEDGARGRRIITRDPLGRIVRVERADGSVVRAEFDEAGRVRLLDSAGVRIETEVVPGASPVLRVRDGVGETRVDLAERSWSVTRDAHGRAAKLRAEHDRNGRLRSVQIPGSPLPLEFTYADDGCVLRYGGRLVARLVERADRRRWRVGAGVLEERREGTRWTLSAKRVGADGVSVTLLTDLLGRTIRRSYSQGLTEEFSRDPESRLVEYRRRPADDAAWRRVRFLFENGELERIVDGDADIRRETDATGRVHVLVRPDGTSRRYEYDARGRCTAADDVGGITRYEYDGLDRLTRVALPDGREMRAEYDGLGRRVRVLRPGHEWFEHRDVEGRLWAVTDADGRAVVSYVWFEGRILLRIDGPLDSSDITGYLCDPVGTPLLAMRCRGSRECAPDVLDAAPYGSVDDPLRPTLYGHVGDPLTGLIHCGARELDPETGTFLTPELWHGGGDDERRWADTTETAPEWLKESGAGQRHDYALCRFDPVGRADYDGHVSGGAIAAGIFRALGNIILAPTWGMPLTSISLFFFLPFNLYTEVIAGIVAIGLQRHPWKNHSIFGLRGLFGSLRQGQVSFALNGFLPRVISGGGVGADRAVTIGNVIWINRHELKSLDRPLTVELNDISGAAGVTAFNAHATRRSIVALDITDSDGKHRIHAAYWSRGFGNSIKTVGAGTALAFDDRAIDGKRRGTIHLSAPVPLGWDPPDEADDKEKLTVREYMFDPAAPRPASDAVVVDDVWFALKLEQNKSVKLKNGDAIEVEATANLHIDHAHVVVGKIQDTDDFSLVFLLGELPARFKTANVRKDMIVHRLTDDTSVDTIEGWTDGATRDVLEAPTPAAGKKWPPTFAKDDLVKVKAATAVAAPAHLGLPGVTPNIDTTYTRVKTLTATLEFADALPAGFGASTAVTTMAGKGKVQAATLKAEPGDVEFADGPSGLSVGDYVSVKGPKGETYAKVTSLTGKTATVSIIGPALGSAPPANLQIRKLEDRTGDDDPKGTAASPTGTSITFDVQRLKPFVPGLVLHLKDGANESVRAVTKLAKARLTLSDEVVGTKPFTVSGAKRDGSLCRITDVERPAMPRFLRHTGASLPSAYGKFPDDVLEVSVPGGDLRLSAFFVKDAPGLHKTYTRTWAPIEFDGNRYFVLDEDLPIAEDEDNAGKFIWKYDPDEQGYRSYRWRGIGVKPAGGFQVSLREYHTSGAERGAGGTATAHSGEVVVPADPQFRYSLGDALQEHEIHHTLQGNYWGPLLGGFPLQAAIMSVADLAELKDGVDAPWWFRDIPSDFFGGSLGLNAFQTFSIGGIMYFAWKFLFLPVTYFSEDARNAILEANFSTFNRVFNPFWGNLIAKFPQIEPNLSQKHSDPGVVIARLLARAMDLRSWTPFIGLVPTWLPDGPQNPIEQGASRMSGDLYSTIISTDDRFNAKLAMRVADGAWRDDHGADRTKELGGVFRLMVYPGDRWERVFPYDHCDRPADAESPVVYNVEPFVVPIARITAPAGTLFHPELYEVVGPAPGTVPVEGPRSNAAVVQFLSLPAAPAAPARPPIVQPLLRSLVPLPPRVLRTAGIYFIAAQPGTYDIETYDSRAGKPGDALTQKVKLTVAGKVLLGTDEIAWQAPVAHPAVPVAPKVERFVAERVALTMKDAANDVVPTVGYEARIDPVGAAPAAKAALTQQDKQWELVTGDTAATLRVRVYRIFRKNDPANDSNNEPAFDLMYDGVKSLRNVRSYLEKDLWVPVRDFIVEAKALPAFAAKVSTYDVAVDVDLPMSIEPSAIVITPPAGAPRFPTAEKKNASTTFPRGHVWRFGPLDKVVEDTAVYKVEATFGSGGVTVKGGFDLTINPVITLKAATFEASKGSPLTLTIEGGAPGFSLDTDTEVAGTAVALDSAGRKVTVTVTTAPLSAKKIVVTVTDNNGKKGKRTVTVK